MEPTHVLVDVFDHPVEAGLLLPEAEIGETLRVFLRGDEGTMWSVRAEVGEEGFLRRGLGLDPAERGGEKDVGAEALGPDKATIVADHGVGVGIVRRVGARAVIDLADPASPVDEDFIETSLLRLVFRLVAEVPFPENA